MNRLRSIGSTAEISGVSKDSIRRLIKSGALKAVRVLRRVMVPESEIERLCSHGCKPMPPADGSSTKQ